MMDGIIGGAGLRGGYGVERLGVGESGEDNLAAGFADGVGKRFGAALYLFKVGGGRGYRGFIFCVRPLVAAASGNDYRCNGGGQ